MSDSWGRSLADRDIQHFGSMGVDRMHLIERSKRRGRATALAVGFVVACLVAVSGAASAQANELVPGFETPQADRVIDLSNVKMPVASAPATRKSASDSSFMVYGEVVPLPVGKSIRAGETVEVIYADGVAIHQALSAACTVTVTAGVPSKSGSNALSRHTYYVGAGCTDAPHGAQAIISSFAWPLWHSRAQSFVSVNAGWTATFFASIACSNSNSTSWMSTTGRGANVIATSGQVNLACGV